jgi:3-deoxy-D-manno-octulosonic-acid transferase
MRVSRRNCSQISRVYRILTWLGCPLISIAIKAKYAHRQQADGRLSERFGYHTAERPPGRLVWFHGVSVGETISAIPIVEAIRAGYPHTTILFTTGTETAAEALLQRTSGGIIHQFVPVDMPQAVQRFLNYWRPNLALFVESELWPNLITQTARRGVSMALLNARISERSARRWSRLPTLAAELLSCFDMCFAQDSNAAARLKRLGARQVIAAGNLKYSAPELPCHAEDLTALKDAIRGRKVWLAASTHEGEESIVADAHARLKASFPDLLTFIVPRHPQRGSEIVRNLRGLGFRPAVRSRGEPIVTDSDFYVADSLGELGLFYQLAPIAIVGATLVPKGGHNPLEAARSGCAILFGPHIDNNADIYRVLVAAGGAVAVTDAADIAGQVGDLLRRPHRVSELSKAARDVAATEALAASRVMEALQPLLCRLA